MTCFDFIGMQINITDSWPADGPLRRRLRQTSDYIEIINDLNECAVQAHYLTAALSPMEMELQQSVAHRFPKPGLLARSIESSLLSKYGRCFNGSEARTRLDKDIVKRALNGELLEHHEFMLARRDKVIAHAEDLEGRQQIRVLNKDEPPADWRFDISSSIDFIPEFTVEQAQIIEKCCDNLANCCFEKATKSFSSFTSLLTVDEAEELRKGHYLQDKTGSAYPVIPPASSRK